MEGGATAFADPHIFIDPNLEPFRKVVESVESDVIHCGAPESRRVLDVEARTSPCR